MKKIDLGLAFEKLKEETFIKHRGVLLEKMENGFRYDGMEFGSLEEFDEWLDSEIIKKT